MINFLTGVGNSIISAVPSQYLVIGTTVMAVIMGVLVMFVRVKAANKPVSAKKIIIPPIAMSSGAFMFFFESFRVAPLQILEACAVGSVFSLFLISTSKFEIRDGDIFLKRSKAFFFILIGLLLFRVVAKLVLSDSFDVGELGGMFWILAFSMIAPWRIAMLVQYKKLKKTFNVL